MNVNHLSYEVNYLLNDFFLFRKTSTESKTSLSPPEKIKVTVGYICLTILYILNEYYISVTYKLIATCFSLWFPTFLENLHSLLGTRLIIPVILLTSYSLCFMRSTD